MSESHRVVHLDDIERVPVEDDDFRLDWLPVRATLGVGAFGTNAYVAANAGDHVVEPHTEEGSGHEELYFVARGRARFTLGGEVVDARAGTYVFLPDPAEHREAVAEEPGTTVLSFGASPTGPYTVSAWEWAFRAGAIRGSDPAAARAILADGIAARPGAGSLRYELARVHALAGERDAALDALAEAVRLRPDTAGWAARDGDLAALRDDPRFPREDA